MTGLPESEELVARLRRAAGPLPGADWRDVNRRARGPRRRALLAALVCLAVLAVAIPASGLDSRLTSWLSVSSGSEVVPGTRTSAIDYVYGNRLFHGSTRVATLAAPLFAPLLGQERPLAVGSGDGRYVVYHSWDGAWGGSGAPTLRLYDRRTGRDSVLRRGAQSVAWHPGGAIAYMQAARPVYLYMPPRPERLPGGYYGQVVVRPSLAVPAVAWTAGPPWRYTALAWARDRLLVAVGQSNLAVPAPELEPGIYAFTGPGKSRRLPIFTVVAVSPDGTRVIGASKPADEGVFGPDLRLVRVRDGKVLATLSSRELARAAGVGQRPIVGAFGAWAGDRIVVPVVAPYGNVLAVLRVGARRITVERVIVIDLTARPRGYRGPWVYSPVFLGRSRTTLAVRADMASRDEMHYASVFLRCHVDKPRCVGGRKLPALSGWGAIVQNPSRPSYR
jgi:hypothetical protein